MIKVSEVVQHILESSDIELEAMRRENLNLSAYAQQILPEVEELTLKPVQKSTVVVSLARLQKKVAAIPPLRPTVYLSELSVKSPLADVTFEKTRHTVKQSRSLSASLAKYEPQFLTITQGANEITVVVSQDQLVQVVAHVGVKPKAIFKELVGLTVSFSEAYLHQPNVIYTLLSALAGKRINIIEIVSTYTELSMIIEQQQLELSIQTLNKYFRPSQKK